MNLLTVSGSPHVHGKHTVRTIMWGVVMALIPALLVSVYYFGLSALWLTLTAVVSCVAFEYIIQRGFFGKEVTITDGSAVITGLLLAFNVPSSLPLWQVVLGSLFAIGVAKMTYGGLGKNPFNPALAGRVFLLISFPVDMTNWPIPSVFGGMTDAITGTTALGVLKEGVMNGETVSQLMTKIPSNTDMFIGNIGGSLGEVSAIAILLGGLFLIIRRIITWHIPVSFLLTVAVFSGILWHSNPDKFADPVFHLLAGGLMLGAIFMATDMVTSPMTSLGMIVFGIGCGVLTILIRVFGSYPEGVSFAILIMNAVTPLINKAFKPKQFGEVVKNG